MGTAFIGLGMMQIGWYDLFRPRWYQTLAVVVGGMIFAYLSFRALVLPFLRRDTKSDNR